ncbi:Phage integrase family protein [Arcobacter porcinus]|nr:Phage integrase family protein [Arcobacter porcinus]
MKYLVKHKTCFYFRRKIPLTQKNFTITLRTDSEQEAKFIVSIINPKFQMLGSSLKMEWEDKLRYLQNLMAEYVQEAKKDYSFQRIEREKRYAYITKKGKKRSGSHPAALVRAEKKLYEVTFSTDEKLRKETYNTIISSSQMLDKFKKAEKVLNDDEFKVRLIDEVLKNEVSLLANDRIENESRMNEIIRDNNIEKVNETTITTPIQEETKPNNNYYKKTTKEIIEIFLENKKVTEIHKYKKPLDIFLELTNKEYLEDLTSEDMLNFLNLYKNMPNENGKVNPEDLNDRRTYRTVYLKDLKTYKEWIELTIKKDLDRVSGKTLKDKLIRISAFLDFAVGLDYLSDNRLKYHQLSINKDILRDEDDDNKRKSYRIEQLENLFSSRWFTEELEDNLKNYPSRIWIPLVMMHTGGRTNEISQIKVNQIIRRDSVFVFNLKNEGKDQRIKNKSSRRKVPIHNKLIELGFLEFLEKQKIKGVENLFDDLYLTAAKGYGADFSKDFLPYREEFLEKETMEKILKKDILLDTYSLRHTFTTQLRRALISEEDISLILGHKKNQTQRYGSMPMDILKAKVDKADYNLNSLEDLKVRIQNFYKKD